jgi:hypothetical protein
MATTTLNLEPAGAVINPSFVQGETFALQLTWKAGSPVAAVDLTDYTARMMIRNHPEAADALLSLTEADGITLGGAAGTILITLTATQTATLPARALVYDIELVSPAGVVTNIARGEMAVLRNVTR